MKAIGIDVVDDRVLAVAVDERGAVVARSRGTARPQELANAVRSTCREVMAAASPSGTGITLPAHDDALDGELRRALAQETGAEPYPIDAGHAAALAETWCGAAQGLHDVVTFSIGDHVTAGIISAGELLTGAHGHASSVAWLTLNPVEREDYRRLGGLEAEVSAAGIVRRLVWRVKSGDPSSVVDRVNGELTRLTAADVLMAARQGDGVCLSVVRDTAKYVGMAVANLACVVDPECIVLGGTLATAGDLMLDSVRAECARRLRPAQSERVRIVLSSLGDDAAAIGAARAVMLRQ